MGSTFDIRKIIKKLDHELIEIRQRSIQNIVGKLSHNIIYEEDLIHHQELFTNLFKLLNKREEVKRVLFLFETLSKHPGGGHALINLGAVDFFTLLQHDIEQDASIVNSIDTILNQLYHAHKSTTTAVHVEHSPDYRNNVEVERIQSIQVEYENEKNNTYEINNTSSVQHENSTYLNINSTSSSTNTMVTIQTLQKQHEGDDFTFNWISLTSSDRQVLAVTHNRIKSSSPQLIKQSCKFFKDVLLHDFPTEVFIQRPSIVEAMLESICGFQERRKDVTEEIILCLYALMRHLYKRSLQNQNKVMLHCKYDADNIHASSISTNITESSSLSSMSAVLQNNIQIDANQNVEPNTEEGEFESSLMTEALIQAQRTGVEISLKVFSTCLDLLALYFNDNDFFVLLVNVIVTINKHLYLHSFTTRWENPCNTDNKYIYQLMRNIHKFDTLHEVINAKNVTQVNEAQETELKAVIVCKLLVKLIEVAVPQARIYEVLTVSLVHFCESILLKVTYMESLPLFKHSLEKIVQYSSEGFYTSYKQVKVVIKSFTKYDQFIEVAKESKKELKEFCILSNKVLPGLLYYTNPEFIQTVCTVCSEHFVGNNHARKLLTKLVLDLMTHQSVPVQIETYQKIYELLEVSFSESLVSNPLSTKHQQAMIFIQQSILNEIITNGLFNKNSKVNSLSYNIISLILNSRLNISSKLWRSLIVTLSSLMCYIQAACFADNNTYDKSVNSLITYPLTIIDVSGNIAGLSSIDLLKTYLRLMFSKIKQNRQKGFALLFLSLNEYKKKNNFAFQRPLNEADKIKCCNMYIFDASQSFSMQESTFHNVSSDNILKLWQVLTDGTVTSSLRHSAAQQISILLQDRDLQKKLLGKQVYKFCLDEIADYLQSDSPEVNNEYMTSLVSILKHLCYHETSIRQMMSLQDDIYFQLFMLTLSSMHDKQLQLEIGCVLCLLLFDDVIKSENSIKLKMPSHILKNFQLPVEFSVVASTKANEGQGVITNSKLIDYMKYYCYHKCEGIHEVGDNEQLHLTDDEITAHKSLSFHHVTNTIVQSLLNLPNENTLNVIGQYSLLLLISANEVSDICYKINTSFKGLCSKEKGLIARVLNYIPSNEDDSTLCSAVITLIHTMLSTIPDEETLQSIGAVLLSKEVSNMVQLEDNATQCKSSIKTQLVSIVCEYFKLLQDHGNVTPLIQSIFHTLSDTGSQSYYDLPRMEIMLECLMHLLTNQKWSLHIISGKSFCVEVFTWLTQIVISFHVERIGATLSLMGKGIVKKAVMCLCHLLHEIKTLDNDMSWLNTLSAHSLNNGSNETPHHHASSLLPWLLPLLSDRSSDIRWAGWAISSALITEEIGQTIVVQEFQNFPGGIWASIVSVVVDDKECSLIRKEVCCLISKLLEKKICDWEASESLWESMIVQDTGTKDELIGIEAFLLLLDHFNFYEHMKQIFVPHIAMLPSDNSQYYVNASTSISPTNISRENDVIDEQQESYSLPSKSSTSNNTVLQPVFICLPLKTSILNLLRHLYLVGSSEMIVDKWNEHQLIQVIFGSTDLSILIPSTNQKQEETVLTNEQQREHTLPTNQSVLSPNEIHQMNDEIHHLISKINLIRVVIRNDKESCATVLSEFSEKIFRLFYLHQQDVEQTKGLLFRLWSSVVSLLTDLMKSNDVERITNMLMRDENFIAFSRCLLVIHDHFKFATSEYISNIFNFLLLLFNHLFNTSLHRIDEIEIPKDLQELVAGDSTPNKKQISGGEFICYILMKLQNKIFHRSSPPLVKYVISCLFAVSRRAQDFALANGIVESSIEEMKDYLVKLKMVAIVNDNAAKKKKQSHLSGLCDNITFVRNLCYKNNLIKTAFIKRDLSLHLSNIWTWCDQYNELQKASMQLFIVLTADCVKAQTAFLRLTNKQSFDESNMFNHVLKLFNSLHGEVLLTHGKWNVVLRMCFQFITNSVGIAEARNSLSKANIFNMFPDLYTLMGTGNKYQRHVAKSLTYDWLKLFTALSFYEDGAKSVAKVSGCLSIFQDVLKHHNESKQECVLLIIRNMMFVSGLKQVITSNVKLISLILEKLLKPRDLMKAHDWMKMKIIAASFFHMLLIDNLKANTCVKKINLQVYLQHLQEDIHEGKYLSSTGDLEQHDTLKYTVTKTLELLATNT